MMLFPVPDFQFFLNCQSSKSFQEFILKSLSCVAEDTLQMKCIYSKNRDVERIHILAAHPS